MCLYKNSIFPCQYYVLSEKLALISITIIALGAESFRAGRRVIISRRVGGFERSEVSMFSFRAGRRVGRAGGCGRLPVPSGAVGLVRGEAGAC